jgi:hypothetical protein
MCDVDLPEDIFTHIEISSDLALHSYEHDQIRRLESTHKLIPKRAQLKLEELGLLNDDEKSFVECNFIGTTNTNVCDVVWISNAAISEAKLRYKFDNFFQFK